MMRQESRREIAVRTHFQETRNSNIKRHRTQRNAALVAAVAAFWLACAVGSAAESDDEKAFEKLDRADWREVFSDPCTGDWHKNWFLDGEKAKVSSGKDGMTIDTAAGYAVLWTKRTFQGDLKIEYDFKRLDANDKGVNIIYIQAAGDGQGGHDEDITRWSDERKDAAMSDYYNNMHTYHISYAAYGPEGEYVRGRRYMPLAGKGLRGTELSGSYQQTGLFDEPSQWIHVTVVKKSLDLYIRFQHPDKTLPCRFKNEDKPPIDKGRIGLRLMPARKSLFKNFRVSYPGKARPDATKSR